MKKVFNLLLLICLNSLSYADNDLLLQAKLLFNHGKYSASQSILQGMHNSNVANAEIMYLNARCSKELFMIDAVFLYNELNMQFPHHNYKDEVAKDLAQIYYREQQYESAISHFLTIQYPTNEEVFKLAYCFFNIGALEDAQLYFLKIMNADSKFSSAAQYYYASILYEKGLYKSALENFKKLLNDEKFGKIAPYYISQIYFYQQKYKQLIVFAKPLYENVIDSRRSEVNRLLAEAYYRTDDFENAITHFEEFVKLDKQISSLVYFLLGHSHFMLDNYEYAISNLEQVLNASDSVMQYSCYYLGASYLALKKYNYALPAFKKSATYNYNTLLQEDAYYNYAKLSYQLDLPFENSIQILTNYLETYRGHHNEEEIKLLLAQTLQATNQYQQAYTALIEIDLPNIEQQKLLQQLAFFLGVKHFNQGNFKEAILYFNNSSKYPLNDTYLYLSNFWIADCYFQLGFYEKAINVYNSLLFSSDKNISIYEDFKKYNLGYCYFQTAEYSSAVKWFRLYEKVASDSLKIIDNYLRIADSYFMLNEFSLAAKYYEKVAKFNFFDIDYALYQYSVSLGLIGKDALKIEVLKKIILNFSSSSYCAKALYDLARHYKNISSYDLAIEYYSDLISFTSDENLIADSYLSRGMMYFNTSKTEQAIEEFLFVVNNYQQTKYFKEALSALQSAYSSSARIAEYLEVIKSLPEISISEAEQDSLTYHAAFMNFSEMDYVVAKAAFDKYLEMFDNGIFINDAVYYNAISSLKIGDTISAALNFEKIVEDSLSSFQEEALIFLARKAFKIRDNKKSNKYYTKLWDFASSNSIKREIIIRLMILNEQDDKKLALEYAKKVMDLEKIDNLLLTKAYIILARSEFELGNYAKSKSTFEKVSKMSFSDEGAEAKYFLAYLTFLDEDFLKSEQLIFALADDYTSDYFIARAFILLSDIYVAQNNLFQAKATLESIIDNHEGDNLLKIAQKKLEVILQAEEELANYEPKQQFYIEILEDDIEYEVGANDWEEKIDENYTVPVQDTTGSSNDSLRLNNKNIFRNEFE